jgi:hypothetical protein
MIELRPAFNEALRNLGNWRNKYPSYVYPHKIVLNMMYRAYSTRLVYQAFANDEMPDFDNFQEASRYVMEFYGETAIREVMPYLEGWMANQPYEEVGTLTTARYETLATQAETIKKYQEELEFSYIFELLNDMSVLYYIAFRLTGESEVDAIAKMSDIIIEPLKQMNYTICKQIFQQLLVGRFMSMNYHPLP